MVYPASPAGLVLRSRHLVKKSSLTRCAFLDTDPTDEPTASRLPVTLEQAGSLNAGTCITMLTEVPQLEQQAIPRASIPN